MCKFFSFLTDGKGNMYYFDFKVRAELAKDNPNNYEIDSHSSIAAYYNLNEDKLNKYEYDPIYKKLTIDQINNPKDDSKLVEKKMKSFDFTKVIENSNFHEVINPLNIVRKNKKVTKKEIELLKEYISMRASVWDSVRVSVGDSVWDSVLASVGDSVRDSVRDSVLASVGDSVRDSVWGSVRDSVGAQIGHLFFIKQWKYCEKLKLKDYVYPFQSCVELWNRGLVVSFDGTTWKLHAGKDAHIVYELKA